VVLAGVLGAAWRPLARARLPPRNQDPTAAHAALQVEAASTSAPCLDFSRIVGHAEGEGDDSEEGYDSDAEPAAAAAAKPAGGGGAAAAAGAKVAIPSSLIGTRSGSSGNVAAAAAAAAAAEANGSSSGGGGGGGKAGFDPLRRGAAKGGQTAVAGLGPQRADPRADHSAEQAASQEAGGAAEQQQQGQQGQQQGQQQGGSEGGLLGQQGEPEGPNTDDFSLPPCPG
jgi:hypothetical protein